RSTWWTPASWAGRSASLTTAAIQCASPSRSASRSPTSRRRESATTSHTRPAPTTSPTISSHQLNSEFTSREYRDRPPERRRPRRHGRSRVTAPYTPRMIDITPDPIFVRIRGFPVYWYGIAYAGALAAAYWVMIREVRYCGLDVDLLGIVM